MPKQGDILLYSDFPFSDGTKADKFFVILNNADLTSPCLVLKTTSQVKRYLGVNRGCNPSRKVFFMPANWEKCFKKDTYVQLPEIIEISMEELLNGSLKKQIKTVGSLSPSCLALLRGCLKNFRDDIALSHWKLIF